MKKNEKGFTLIELLAVIVILAIIALIATPIVMNVINKSRQKAAEDSAYGVVEAVKAKHAELMLNTSSDVSESITVTWSGGTGTITGSTDKVSVTGTKPTGGTVTINSTGDVTVDKLLINGYSCSTKANSDIIECKNSKDNPTS